MRPRVSWMTQGDDRILETLESSGIVLSPAVLAYNTDYTRNYVNKRLRKLRHKDLVVRVDSGYYEITDRGRAYLAGNLNSEDLE
ncbi:transcriptional regulator [Halorubrum pleomorphic virus 9]|uniref:PhiH1-like repressor n=1 Tax=Halorubrum pleomorphic virus 9 TaxID=2126525 RepID=A0A3S7I7H7_9VIRU|nr:transcriptional regulator [Halorubrum pleomorphic virus 9]AVP39969.1 PhiH1-like repressor [Halorubrum pleomorphic virus 9]